MGLMIDVYRSGPDCSLGGVSTHDRLCLVDGLIPATAQFEPTEDMPAVVFDRTVNGEGPLIVVPAVWDHGMWVPERRPGIGPLHGGAFAYSHDSRFARAVGNSMIAIPIFDRFESQATYNLLST